jgi:hypothetical protein
MSNVRTKRGTIAILTGGGDVPGLNPAIRALTVRALREGPAREAADEQSQALQLPVLAPLAHGEVLDQADSVAEALRAAAQGIGHAVDPRSLAGVQGQPVCLRIAGDLGGA